MSMRRSATTEPAPISALLLRPDGHKIVVRFDSNCRIGEAIVDEQVVLFGNYSGSGTTVDIAVINPGGTISIVRGLQVQPGPLVLSNLVAPMRYALSRSSAPGTDRVGSATGSFRKLGNVTADTTAEEELAALHVLGSALSGWGCTEAALVGLAGAAETFGGSLV